MTGSMFQPFGTQGSQPPSPLVHHPSAIIAMYVAAFALTAWTAYQVRHRCASCGLVPARCKCASG
jgi:hypothetical protein